MPIVDLHRTFSELRLNVEDGQEYDWGQFLGHGKNRKTWEELHENPLVVILGEAGIGKTIEFRNEANRLREAGRPAFFIALDQISDLQAWHQELLDHNAMYRAWEGADELGFFFLDSVDEARLKTHADFKRALGVVQQALDSTFARVRIAISTRTTDWTAPAVQSAIEERLAKPIERALAANAASATSFSFSDSPAVEVLKPSSAPTVKASVVSLDPLSDAEAHRCAKAFGLSNESTFWTAVAEGDYQFMATRPLDLRWMVDLWNQRGSLGTYIELIEANIANRLCEFNESYQAAGEVLSVDQLRSGAIELAAATEFGGCAYLTLDSSTPSHGEVPPWRLVGLS